MQEALRILSPSFTVLNSSFAETPQFSSHTGRVTTYCVGTEKCGFSLIDDTTVMVTFERFLEASRLGGAHYPSDAPNLIFIGRSLPTKTTVLSSWKNLLVLKSQMRL